MFRHPIILISLLMVVLGGTSCGSSSRMASERDRGDSKEDVIEEYAAKLRVSPNDLEDPQLYSFVDEWYGTPYQYGGLSRNGVDCSGFINLLYSDVYDISLPRKVEDIYDECDKRFRRKKKLKEGDLVFFDIKKGKKASHIGVYLQNDKFVHASSSRGVLISDLGNPYYEKHFHKGGRIR